MYIIKHRPEDFLVTEISAITPKESGTYIYYKLVKKNWNTLDAVQRIARELGIKGKQVGFAGSKDRNALTEQAISFIGVTKEKIDAIKVSGFELQFLGRGEQPISLGDLDGNKFEIRVRNLDGQPVQIVTHFHNYFDEQRFSGHNVIIGKHLLKKEFEQAVKSIHDARYQQTPHLDAADYIGKLRQIPLRMLRMYLNAYQSYLWNELLALYLKDFGNVEKEIPYSQGELVFVKNYRDFLQLKIPLIGFATADYAGEAHEIVRYLMKKESIAFSDFVIRQIPELSLEGELRDALVEVKKLQIGGYEEDEFFPGKKKILLTFSLPKGSYATMLLRQMLG